MEKGNSSESNSPDFKKIQALVHQGKSLISAENSAIVNWAKRVTTKGETATLYLPPLVFQSIRRWYWTPTRAKAVGLKPISADLAKKIKKDFDIEIDGQANSIECPRCGHEYSTYEFIQQGSEEHGEKAVREAFSLKRAAILQVNPVQNTICRNCKFHIIGLRSAARGIRITYHYDYWCIQGNAYACCNSYIIRDFPDEVVIA